MSRIFTIALLTTTALMTPVAAHPTTSVNYLYRMCYIKDPSCKTLLRRAYELAKTSGSDCNGRPMSADLTDDQLERAFWWLYEHQPISYRILPLEGYYMPMVACGATLGIGG
jgi:hypothetical protein